MKPAFLKESEFSHTLKSRVRDHISEDKQGRFANAAVWMKAILLIAISAVLYLDIIFTPMDFFVRSITVIIFSFSTLLLGLNVMHEAAHGNYSSKPWVNRILALMFDIYGISSDLYVIKHTQFHHNYTNMYEHDGDINEAPIIRMSTQQKWKPIHRFQSFYTPFLYSLITITWPINDLTRLVSAKVGKHSFRRPSAMVTAKILLFKALSFYLTYILPIKILGVTKAVFFILLFHLSLGVVLTLIFQVAHVHEEGKYDQEAITTDWCTHQLQTSADFSTNNPLAIWISGGLNFQVIHHLFPNVSYRHYPAIQKILKQLCEEEGYRYVEFPSFRDAVRTHFKWLQQLSKG
jgi:linoleoyl-CoA desaturase